MSAMPSFEDAANSLGQLVVQVSANAVRSNELAKSTKETYDTAMNYIQELRRAQKDQQELIEDLQKRLEEQPEEPPSKRLRTEEPWAKSRKDLARSDYAESQVESQSGFLCYRCHKHCGSSAKNCEVEIPDLEMSSVLDFFRGSPIGVRKMRGTSLTRWWRSLAAEVIVSRRMGR